MKFLLMCMALLCLEKATAQLPYQIQIKNKAGRPLEKAIFIIGNHIFFADSNGVVLIEDMPPGRYPLTITHSGYQMKTDSINWPPAKTYTDFFLEKEI
jgi:uncharacterized membrane protein